MQNDLPSLLSTATAPDASFRDRYCDHYHVPVADFVPHIMSKSLHPFARVTRWMLTDEFFAPDRQFINSLGFASNRSAFAHVQDEFRRFHVHGFWRRVLKLRVSSRRVRDLFYSEVAH